MSKSNYEKTIDKIKTTESFQNDTIAKLQASLKNEEKINNKKIRYDLRKIGALAASIAFLVMIGLSIIIFNKDENNIVNESTESPNVDEKYNINLDSSYLASLPKLDVSSEFGGMGFGAMMAYNVDELKDANPWYSENDLKSMPVFKNKLYSSDQTLQGEGGLSGDEMLNMAKKLAKTMNINVVEAYTMPIEKEIKIQEEKSGGNASTNPYMAVIKGDGVEINVDSVNRTSIRFLPNKKIPNEYSFTFNKTTPIEAQKTMEYLIKEYNYITELKSPKISLYGDYTFSGEQSIRYNVFENEGSLINKILNYNFNTVNFVPTDNGGMLASIYIESTDLSELIGNYPIITSNEAKELLLDGKYITSVPEAISSEANVASVSLIYRKSARDAVLMPYYEFLVELPSMKQDNGLNTYGIYYVPAISEAYISNMPKYDGSFN